MSKINVYFNDKNYLIDKDSFAASIDDLKSHLSTKMNGVGATINLDGVSYSIDSAKLSSATNDFVNHLGTISGSGHNVTVNGVKYSVDSAKVEDAISELDVILSGLGGSGAELNEYGFYFDKNYFIDASEYPDMAFSSVSGIPCDSGEFYFSKDGSAHYNCYMNGVLVEEISYPAGTFTFEGNLAYSGGEFVGSFENNGKEFHFDGLIFTLEK